MNKALTPGNKRRILRWMKSIFFSEVKKRKMTLFGDSDTVREQGHTKRNIEKVHEEHLKEEHEVKMRILKKKEQLLDLKLFRRKLNTDE